MSLNFYCAGVLFLFYELLAVGAAGTFSVASYNVNNYRLEASETRSRRSDTARASVAGAIYLSKPDIVGLQEMGSRRALSSLSDELSRLGLEYPYSGFLEVDDSEIQCAVLSRFPIREDFSDQHQEFVLYGRAFKVLRGIMEVEIGIPKGIRLRLINVHLKSKLPTWYADEADFRLSEAVVLRERIDRLLIGNPKMNLVVIGDLNDSPDSRILKTVVGRGRKRLTDCRPCEKAIVAEYGSRQSTEISWTHHFERRDGFFRYDYILISPALGSIWRSDLSSIPRYPSWQIASDHRLIQAAFEFTE